MKNLLIIGTIIVLIGIGYYFYYSEEREPVLPDGEDAEETQQTLSGTVVSVDLEQIVFDGPALIAIETDAGESRTIAVPSMSLPLCDAVERIAPVSVIEAGDTVSVSGAVDEEGRIVPCESDGHYLEVIGEIRDETLGYAFTYPKGTYIRLEDTESEHTDFLSGLTLFDRIEYQELEESTDAREGPPAITVRIYENTQNLSASVWAMRNPRESNIELSIGEPAEAVVGGANAEHYTVDGLWPTNTYVVAHGGNIYVLMGAYSDTDAQIYQDFQDIVGSLSFIQTSEQVGDGQPEESGDEMVACTMDAKMCPDGSYVGRVPPSCQFAPCPGE